MTTIVSYMLRCLNWNWTTWK